MLGKVFTHRQTGESTVKTFAEAEEALARSLPGYESRPQQQALARAIEHAIEAGRPLLAQAGCGTGKSLGSMIPAILSGKRTVVSTATIALQEQYANKDVPFLAEHLGKPFTWALLKGRSNYVCMAKVTACSPDDLPQINAVREELTPEFSGDVEHLVTPVDRRDRQHITISSAECPGKRDCPFGSQCYAEQAKYKAREAQVVITNHAMLLTDLKVREASDNLANMLDSYDVVVLDEAHEIEEIATNQLREELRLGGIAKFCSEVTNFSRNYGPGHLDATTITGDLMAATRDLFTACRPGPMTMAWLVNNADPFVNFVKAARDLALELDAWDVPPDRKVEFQKRRIIRRALNYSYRVRAILELDEDQLVRFVEEEERGNVIVTVPLHVGEFLNNWLWSQCTPVLISATLAVGNDFSFIQDRLSLTAAQTIDVGTPFDYLDQLVLYVPPRTIKNPSEDRSAWLTATAFQTERLVKASGGGALLLFTSRDSMERSRSTVGAQIERMGFNVFMQGDEPNKVLAQKFLDDKHSVLFALKSFFTGVDFPGETCRLVIIDKMPFPVPSDPVFKARGDVLDKQAGRQVSFSKLSVPMMTLTLLQGVGRAIRTKRDRAVVAILDSRLESKGYGRQIMRSLPPGRKTTDLAEVERFYS
jgi:ATP-dependent DNA helicase DinG